MPTLLDTSLTAINRSNTPSVVVICLFRWAATVQVTLTSSDLKSYYRLHVNQMIEKVWMRMKQLGHIIVRWLSFSVVSYQSLNSSCGLGRQLSDKSRAWDVLSTPPFKCMVDLTAPFMSNCLLLTATVPAYVTPPLKTLDMNTANTRFYWPITNSSVVSLVVSKFLECMFIGGC